MNISKWKRDLKMAEAEKLARSAFVTVCANCGDILSVRYDLGQCGLSHGICQKDADAEMAKAERELRGGK